VQVKRRSESQLGIVEAAWEGRGGGVLTENDLLSLPQIFFYTPRDTLSVYISESKYNIAKNSKWFSACGSC
jgi:hypothetical protein